MLNGRSWKEVVPVVIKRTLELYWLCVVVRMCVQDLLSCKWRAVIISVVQEKSICSRVIRLFGHYNW